MGGSDAWNYRFRQAGISPTLAPSARIGVPMATYVDDDRSMPRFRVNREAMVDPTVLADERRAIFDRCWLYVGHESEIENTGDFRTRTVGGRPVILARDSGGSVNVLINSCPHRGAMVCREPQGRAKLLTCFYHGWSFRPSGELAMIPDPSSYGPDFDRPSLARPPLVDAYRGFIFVNFDPYAVDLLSYLAGAREYLDLICDQSEARMVVLKGTHDYSVKANWKLLVENSYDGYHALTTHQRYFRMVMAASGEIDASAILQSRGIDLGNGHAVNAGGPKTGTLLGRPLSAAGLRERAERHQRLQAAHGTGWVDRMRGTRNLVIFPNLVVIDLVMGVLVRKIDPITPDYMDVSAWHLAPVDEGADLRRQRLDNFLTFWGPGGLATPDDVEALETCQRSYASIAELGWSDISRGMNKPAPSGSDELQMRVWWRRWNELVTGTSSLPEDVSPLEDMYAAPRGLAASPVA
jgi:benzoate/toluate 1,2-dioxygenase alpha subunit